MGSQRKERHEPFSHVFSLKRACFFFFQVASSSISWGGIGGGITHIARMNIYPCMPLTCNLDLRCSMCVRACDCGFFALKKREIERPGEKYEEEKMPEGKRYHDFALFSFHGCLTNGIMGKYLVDIGGFYFNGKPALNISLLFTEINLFLISRQILV